MVTAAHCWGLNTQIYTAGGTTWAYGNGQTGNWVGKVTARNENWDAELLDGANNNADESDTSGGWGSVQGDSGGTVFGLLSGNNRQARGIISAGGADGTSDQARVDWTEATDIFNAFGLKLNPQT